VPVYCNRIYPHFVSRMGDPKPIRAFVEKSFAWLAELSLKSDRVPERIFRIMIPRESPNSAHGNQMRG
jgi:hypothetical protein